MNTVLLDSYGVSKLIYSCARIFRCYDDHKYSEENPSFANVIQVSTFAYWNVTFKIKYDRLEQRILTRFIYEVIIFQKESD